jgi:hypothetical protein
MSRKAKKSPKTTTRTRTSHVRLPLGLDCIVRRCAGEGANMDVHLEHMRPAYAMALQLLDSQKSDVQSDLADSAGRLSAEHVDVFDTRRELLELVRSARGRYTHKPEEVVDDLVTSITWPATDAGFRLGLAIAFEITRSFTGGAR